MDNTHPVYIYDAGTGKLIIRDLPRTIRKSEASYEEAIQICAETNDMHWCDCEWGGIREISINL